MSLRAIKKTQLRLEQQLKAEAGEHTSSSEGDDTSSAAPAPKPNAFAMLGGLNDDEEDDEDDEENNDDAGHGDASRRQEDPPAKPSEPRTSKRKKKRKTKGKGPKKNVPEDAFQKRPTGDQKTAGTSETDEIDDALHSLALSAKEPDTAVEDAYRQEMEWLCSLVAVDPQHLIAANEMRRLFGRAVVESEGERAAEAPGGRRPPGGRRHRREQAPQGIAGALAGQRRAGARRLAALSRRNLFVQGKEEWPPAVGVGLEMKIVGERPSGVARYAFAQNESYMDAQKQFFMIRGSMDTDRLIQHLEVNPWHIGTLLQASEIAEASRDYALMSDFIERALFSFGRAVHSTFADRIPRGKARFASRWAPNGEFCLAVKAHVKSLGKRALWRTAYEWEKLLLALTLNDDQFLIGWGIDQTALRSHQAEHFLDLADHPNRSEAWSTMPNIAASIPLALLQLGEWDEARRALFMAIKDRPWVFNRLFQELGIDRIPRSIWGSEPRTPHEQLLAEVYVHRAADLWKTPEATSLLVEVAGISEQMLPAGEVDDGPIRRDEAVAVLAMEVPHLTALLPRDLVAEILDPASPLSLDTQVELTTEGDFIHAIRTL
ncbi:MAG: DNA-binding transcription factor [Watsoniomyces obsoletus]|nr:MAG: DNA-binding transcription factor [Watsoniomyces obsoletus]